MHELCQLRAVLLREQVWRQREEISRGGPCSAAPVPKVPRTHESDTQQDATAPANIGPRRGTDGGACARRRGSAPTRPSVRSAASRADGRTRRSPQAPAAARVEHDSRRWANGRKFRRTIASSTREGPQQPRPRAAESRRDVRPAACPRTNSRRRARPGTGARVRSGPAARQMFRDLVDSLVRRAPGTLLLAASRSE